jgi:hypothetical protein
MHLEESLHQWEEDFQEGRQRPLEHLHLFGDIYEKEDV